MAAFDWKLAELGWKGGIDLRIEYRWCGNSPDQVRTRAAEIVKLNPDVILVSNELTLAVTASATRTIPIVFANVTIPRLQRHYDNITGITAIEPRWPKNGFRCSKSSYPELNA